MPEAVPIRSNPYDLPTSKTLPGKPNAFGEAVLLGRLQFCQEEVMDLTLKVPSSCFTGRPFQERAINNNKKTTNHPTKKRSKIAFILSYLVLWWLHMDSCVPSQSPQSQKDTGECGGGPVQGFGMVRGRGT